MIKAALPGMRRGEERPDRQDLLSGRAHHHTRRRLPLRRQGRAGGAVRVSPHGGRVAGAARHGRRTTIVPHPLPERSADRSRKTRRPAQEGNPIT
jgi:hypothetical protein